MIIYTAPLNISFKIIWKGKGTDHMIVSFHLKAKAIHEIRIRELSFDYGRNN